MTVVPANRVSWDDVQRVMGERGDAHDCQCQWFKIRDKDWRSVPRDERAERLREQTACGHPDSPTTSGLVAFLGDEPVGWCAVEPRTAYRRLLRARVPWAGRDEDPEDDGVWAVTCFQVRTGFRRRGVSAALARAAVDFARERGARAVEGYPIAVEPGKAYAWGELYVGAASAFADAGFVEVSAPTKRRRVMRVDFWGGPTSRAPSWPPRDTGPPPSRRRRPPR
jgi:GNAT superfamily N-acetyltransferase